MNYHMFERIEFYTKTKTFVIDFHVLIFISSQATNTHQAIDEGAEVMREAIDDLLKSVLEAPEALVDGMVDAMNKSLAIVCCV